MSADRQGAARALTPLEARAWLRGRDQDCGCDHWCYHRKARGVVPSTSGAILIPLPWAKPPLTGNRTRGNPYARAAEVAEAKEQALEAIFDSHCWAVVGANVALHFRPKDKRRRDADGMFPTMKVCQDALVLAGVLPDDSWVCVPASTCRIHPPIAGEDAAMWLSLDVLTEWPTPTETKENRR